MYSSTKPRVTLAANRSTSLNSIGAASESPTINNTNKHSSSNDLLGSKHSSNFTPAHPRYEVNSEMLIKARKSMEVVKSTEGKGKGTTSPPPPKGQRSLPPLPPLPSHAQIKSPPLPPRTSPITRPTTAAPVVPPTSPEPRLPRVPSASLATSPATPAPSHVTASPPATPASSPATPAPSRATHASSASPATPASAHAIHVSSPTPSAASSPATPAPFAPPAPFASPPTSSPATSSASSPATPASFAPPAPFASPASPVLAPHASAAPHTPHTSTASPPLHPSSAPLSPQFSRPLPSTPKKRANSLVPRPTSPNISNKESIPESPQISKENTQIPKENTQTSKDNIQITQNTHVQVTCNSELTDITAIAPTSQALPTIKETPEVESIQKAQETQEIIDMQQETQTGDANYLRNSQTLVTSTLSEAQATSNAPTSIVDSPQILQAEQESKKDVKYYSNPEPAVSSKDGLVHRHLSAPSSVLSESQLIENASETFELPVNVSLTKSRSAPFSGRRNSSSSNIEIIRVDSLARSSDAITQSNLRASGEIKKDANIRRGSADMADHSGSRNEEKKKEANSRRGSADMADNTGGLRSSVELSGDTNPNLRSWYLKKNSMQKQDKRPIPKEVPEYRKCRKELPELPEITQKNKVIKEIFTTEATYVDDLCVAIKVYKEPISRYKWVSDEDVVAMFQNIEELYKVNKALFSSLLEVIPKVNELFADDSPCPPLGEVFLRHLDYFSCYTTYLCNKELSTRVVKKLEGMSNFGIIMNECKQNRECQGLGLADFLIKPVQRLCKYPLLFKELRKYLVPDDPELPVLNDVISAVEQLASITNQTITNTEQLAQIRKLVGNDIAPFLEGATVVREGTVIVITKSKKEESFFWLLDSAILWHPTKATLRKVVKSSKSSKIAKPKNMLLMSSVTMICGEEYEHHKHSFSLKYKYSDTKEKRVVFCAQSYLEKLCWIDDIKAQLVH